MRFTFKRFLLLGGLVVGLVVAYFFYQLLTPSGPIVISPQTTVITEPLAEDGLPDYASYLLGQMKEGVTPENNGAIPFLQAMWPAEISPLGQSAVCRELGMDVPTTVGMTEPYSDAKLIDRLIAWHRQQNPNASVDDDAALRAWARDELLHHLSSTPWSVDDAPPVADWLQAHESHLDLLGKAARSERYYLPPETLLTDPNCSFVTVLLPHVQTLRSAVRCTSLRANYHVGSGDLGAAWHDCQTIYRLSDTCSQQFLVGELVSIACEGIAHRATTVVLASEELEPTLAEDILEFLTSRSRRNNIRPALDEWERLGYVTAVLEMSGQRQSANPNQGTPPINWDHWQGYRTWRLTGA